jgi:2-isopropylmalate synthase
VRIRHEGKTYVGRGADTDIVVASAKALMNALNRLLAVQRPSDTEVRTSP